MKHQDYIESYLRENGYELESPSKYKTKKSKEEYVEGYWIDSDNWVDTDLGNVLWYCDRGDFKPIDDLIERLGLHKSLCSGEIKKIELFEFMKKISDDIKKETGA